MAFSFLVVDDETLSRNYIHDLILEFEPKSIINEASSVKKALSILTEFKPDVLFLNIRMPEADGFSLLETSSYKDFELVFISAHSQYAIKAFKEGACDYLLKPIKKSEFKITLEKVLLRRKNELERREYSNNRENSNPANSKLIINQQLGVKAIPFNNIIYLKADNAYTTIYTSTGEKILTSKPIHHFEKTLNPDLFFRIHKSHIINLRHFKEYISLKDKSVLMSNGEKLIISRYRLSEFLQRIKTVTL